MDDFLTDQQLDELGTLLREVQSSLRHSLKQAISDSKPVDLDLPIGRLSRMDAMQQQKMAQANRRQSQLRLQQIDLALRRLAGGEYGSCRVCENDIAFARLKARPESALCLECQQELEQRR